MMPSAAKQKAREHVRIELAAMSDLTGTIQFFTSSKADVEVLVYVGRFGPDGKVDAVVSYSQ